MDSDTGRELYKFDRSLMERLADNGMPMSQILVQRRMRPSISHFIRYALLCNARFIVVLANEVVGLSCIIIWRTMLSCILTLPW